MPRNRGIYKLLPGGKTTPFKTITPPANLVKVARTVGESVTGVVRGVGRFVTGRR